VVDEHSVTGADGRSDLAQAQVCDPGVEGVADRGSKQAFPGLRGVLGLAYHMVHVPSGTKGNHP
jgi:hypothetical protein